MMLAIDSRKHQGDLLRGIFFRGISGESFKRNHLNRLYLGDHQRKTTLGLAEGSS